MAVIIQTPPEQARLAIEAVLQWLDETHSHATPRLKHNQSRAKLVLPHRIAHGSVRIPHHPHEEALEIHIPGWRFLVQIGDEIVAAATARQADATYRFAELNEGELVISFAHQLQRVLDQAPEGREFEPILLHVDDVRVVVLWLRDLASLSPSIGPDDVVFPLYLRTLQVRPELQRTEPFLNEIAALRRRTVSLPSQGG